MKLTEIRIDNFRSIKECHLYLSEVTAVIGENNAGKTALLRALNSVFNWEYEQDYFLNNAHQYAIRTTTKIALTFESVPDREIYADKIWGNKLNLELKYAYGTTTRKRTLSCQTATGILTVDDDFLDDNIKITDDVSGEIKEYDIRVIKDVVDVVTGKSVYNSASGEINTIVDSVLEFEISAKDSAGNEAVVKMNIELLPVHLSVENPRPVIYDGEYGLIQIQDFQHGYIYGEKEYFITFYVENETSEPMIVHLADTSVDDYQVDSGRYLPGVISAGKRGTIDNSITDDDIPTDLRDYPQIETLVCLRRDDMDEHSYYRVPLLIDIDAANMN